MREQQQAQMFEMSQNQAQLAARQRLIEQAGTALAQEVSTTRALASYNVQNFTNAPNIRVENVFREGDRLQQQMHLHFHGPAPGQPPPPEPEPLEIEMGSGPPPPAAAASRGTLAQSVGRKV